jgi:serine/threonine protein kinase
MKMNLSTTTAVSLNENKNGEDDATLSINLSKVFTTRSNGSKQEEQGKKENDETAEARWSSLQVPWKCIEMLGPLGRGGFASVFLVEIIDGPLAAKRLEYAMKSLRTTTVQKQDVTFESNHRSFDHDIDDFDDIGMLDLINEAKVLSHISHKNIISFYGISPGLIGVPSCQDGTNDPLPTIALAYLLLEPLEQTLDKYIAACNLEENSLKNTLSRWSTDRKNKNLFKRLENSVEGIVDGMVYLHQQGVVHLDLKPGNIGFSGDGTVKIFDFGFAKRIDAGRTGLCPFEGRVGTPR